MKEKIKDTYYHFYWLAKNNFWVVRDYLFPQNKSLRKVIPNSWCDKDYIVRQFLLQVIISFVEEENPFEVTEYFLDKEDWDKPEWKDAPDSFKEKFYDAGWTILGLYDYAKEHIKKEISSFNYNTYEEFEVASQFEKDILKEIIEVKGHLWT